MPGERVGFEIEPELGEFLRERGVVPAEFAEEMFLAGIRRLKAEEKVDELAEIEMELPRSAEELIREDREAG